jgi:riboflavin transporter FmnP
MKNERFLKKVVLGLLVGAIVFTAIMIWLFYLYQTVPDSLVYAVFGFLGGEAFFTSLIKRSEEGG